MNVNSVVAGTANPCNIYWRVGTSATLNGVTMLGTVIADASITLGPGNLVGRALAGTGATGAVTMPVGGNTIGGCSVAGAGVPTLSEWAMIALSLLLAAAGAMAMRSRPHRNRAAGWLLKPLGITEPFWTSAPRMAHLFPVPVLNARRSAFPTDNSLSSAIELKLIGDCSLEHSPRASRVSCSPNEA